MTGPEFNKPSTGFWGALSAAFWFGYALVKYLASRKAKETPVLNIAGSKISEGMKMESAKKDIKDVLEVLDFGFTLLSAGKEILVGGFHADKLGSLLGVYQKAVPAFDNIGDVIPQLEDLDESEAAQLVAFIAGKGIGNEEASKIIQKSLNVAIAAYALFKEIKN